MALRVAVSRLLAGSYSRPLTIPYNISMMHPLNVLPESIYSTRQYCSNNKVPPSENYRFSKSHEWAALDTSNIATIGVSDHAQDSLGEAVYVDLPDVGTAIEGGDVFGTVESVKAAADLYAPVSGEVHEVNDQLNSSPELVNEDPYNNGWIIKLKVTSTSEYEQLMTFKEYEKFLEETD